MKQPTVLIISDDASFSSAITTRWKNESIHPAFTLMNSDLCSHLDPSIFDLAIMGGLEAKSLPLLEKAFAPISKPAILALAAGQIASMNAHTKVVHCEGDKQQWMDWLVILSVEMLLHAKSATTAQKLEQQAGFLEGQAALGNYMLDMRHNLNNALTSILGNSELLLLDGDSFTATMSTQVETIRNMAVRIHEILQRFSSLEKELTVGEEEARPKNRVKHQVNAAKA